jgi:CBS domain-containing protein
MWVKDVMARPVFVSSDATKRQILAVAKKNPDTDIFVVVDRNKRFLGEITEDDLFLMLLPNDLYDDIGIQLGFDLEKKFFAKTAKEVMRSHDITCTDSDDVMEVALTLAREEINLMPVLNSKSQVVGVVNQGLLLRHMKI